LGWRFGCGALLLTSLYVLTVQTLGKERLAFLLVAVALTLPTVAAVSTLMTIDSPYLACWGWALVFGNAAVRGKRWAWPVAGMIVGIGILAKYTMVLWLPSMGLYLLLSPAGRTELRRGGFWIACAIATLFCLPIVYWNARNGWVSVQHVGWQAGVEQRTGWRWYGPFVFVAGQAGLIVAFWFAAWARAIWAYRPWKSSEEWRVRSEEVASNSSSLLAPHSSLAYLWCMSAPMFGVFLLASLKTTGQINWPAAAYVSGGVLLAAWLDQFSSKPKARRIAILACSAAAVFGIALTITVHFPAVGRPLLAAIAGPPTSDRPMPLRRVDPSCRLRGWRRELAAAVDRVRSDLQNEGIDPVIVTGSWTLPGELAVYCDGHPTVYSVGILFGDRMSQCDLWRPNPVRDQELFVGRTFILVCCTPPIRLAFVDVGPEQVVTYCEAGHPVQQWTVSVGRGFRGFGPTEQALQAAGH
jgi:hypothetical protein